MKSDRSLGYDDISPNIVKAISKQGVFLDKLKIACVTPIFVNDDKSLPINYRPILVLTCFSKLLEHIMYNELYKFVIKNDVLCEKQFGFQAAHFAELRACNLRAC